MKLQLLLVSILIGLSISARLRQTPETPANVTPTINITSINTTIIGNATILNSPLVEASPVYPKNWWQPPYIPKAFFIDDFRIIPPQFWINGENVRAAIFRTLADGNKTLLCSSNGTISIDRPQTGQYDYIWFPEFVAEDIIRLRSYYGGYLSLDPNTRSLRCRARDRSFLTRWEIFINRDANNQCLFFRGHNAIIAAEGSNAQLLPFDINSPNKFCFIGDSTMLDQWKNGNTYFYNFNATTLLPQIGLPSPLPTPTPTPTPTGDLTVLRRPNGSSP